MNSQINKSAVFGFNIALKINISNTIFARFNRIAVSICINTFSINSIAVISIHRNYIFFSIKFNLTPKVIYGVITII